MTVLRDGGMNELIKIYEVGPRDGLQNEPAILTSSQKLHLIAGLINAGINHLEVTSFVNPKAVPQLADADRVMAETIRRHHNDRLDLAGLVFNRRGYDRAIETGCRSMAFGVAVSETFSLRNTRNTPQAALQIAADLAVKAREDGIRTRIYIMTAWVCPFEGPVSPHKTIALARQIADMGVHEIAVADTIGFADPLAVGRLFDQLSRFISIERLAAHLHDTQALGLANVSVALQAGVRIFDTSIGGLGGCPFAPGAAGNLATEDMVFLAYKVGMGTGVDFGELWKVIYELENIIGRPIGGRIRQWWESSQDHDPQVGFV